MVMSSVKPVDYEISRSDRIEGTLERVEEINQLVEAENLPEGFEIDEEGVWYIQLGKREIDPPTRR